MKTKLTILACTFIAPFAFGQAQATDDTSHGARQQVSTNSGDNKIGSLQTFTPGSNLTISSTAMTHPAKYRVAKEVQIQNASGGTIAQTSIRPGTQVSLGFNAEGQVDRITLLDTR
jgi:hypothetical protein